MKKQDENLVKTSAISYCSVASFEDANNGGGYDENSLPGCGTVLELIKKGASLDGILTAVSRVVEEQIGEGICSILLLDPDGMHLRHGAASNLPQEYVSSIDGAVIGPAAGSCGTAIYRRKSVIVTDIAFDPLWKDYRDLACKFGLAACWSVPILSANGDILGTFATYYKKPRPPKPSELKIVEMFADLLGKALSRAKPKKADGQ